MGLKRFVKYCERCRKMTKHTKRGCLECIPQKEEEFSGTYYDPVEDKIKPYKKTEGGRYLESEGNN